jgi:hypothetical protein
LLVSTLLFLAAPALQAQVTLDSLSPDEGTVGSLLDLRLLGDTGKGKPIVWITRADDTSNKPRKTKLKVSAIEDAGGGITSLEVSFKKTKSGAGSFNVHVRPKGKGQVEAVFKSAFTIRAPTATMVTPDEAESRDEITIFGAHFGSPAKPKVFVIPQTGGKPKKAKVRQVNGNNLLAKLPKLADGDYELIVANKVGEGFVPGGITIGERGGDPCPGSPGCPPPPTGLMTATLSSSQELNDTDFNTNQNEFSRVEAADLTPGLGFPYLLITGTEFDISAFPTFDAMVIALIVPFDMANTPVPFTIDFANLGKSYGLAAQQTKPEAEWSTNDGEAATGSLTITSKANNRVVGTFQFTLPPSGDVPADGPLTVTNGQFDVLVIDPTNPGGN